jgi:hypothetical protein
MSQIVLQGDTSGQTVIQAPSTGTQTVTLPAATGTALVNPLPTGTSISASTGDIVRFTGNGVSFPTWTTSARPPGPGTGATATVTVSGGVIQTVTITNQGSNYVNGAAISFTGSGGGTGASATLTTTGGVVNTTVSNLVGGTGYTGTVTATITGVPYTGQTGYNTTLSVNETYNGTSWVAVANTASSAGINFSDGSNIISHAVPQVTVLSAANNSATGTTTGTSSTTLTLNSTVTGVVGVGSHVISGSGISSGCWITSFTPNVAASVTFTGSISGTTLTVTSVSSGTLAVGQALSTSSTTSTSSTLPSIVYYVPGSGTLGGAGTYYLSSSATQASTTLYAYALASGSVLAMSVYPFATTSSTTIGFATPTYGVYTVPTNCKYLYIEMVGGGGAGGGTYNASAGGTGGNTTFGTSLLTTNGGAGGQLANGGSLNYLGTGGTAAITSTSGVSGIAITGANGNIWGYTCGGSGGTSPFGGAGVGSFNGSTNTSGRQAINGSPNSGSGGGGWGTNNLSYTGGVGGGAGGYIKAYITSPSSTYNYSVPIGGNGSIDSFVYISGNGGSGVIIVTAFF